MTPTRGIARADGELLLLLLEQPEPEVSGELLAERCAYQGRDLMACGALVKAAAASAVLVRDEGGTTYRDVSWLPEVGKPGYFDGVDGTVVLDEEQLLRFRVSLDWWLAWLAIEVGLRGSRRPMELVPGHAWDLGEFVISRSRRVPLVYARRLHVDDVAHALYRALEARRGRDRGLILTSTRDFPAAIRWPANYVAMAMSAATAVEGASFSVDVAVLRSPYVATITAQTNESLYLSPDDSMLIINGAVRIEFRSPIHKALIRTLVEGYRTGQRFRASPLLRAAGSDATSLARAFGTRKWAKLSPYLQSIDGLWGFDL